MLQDTHPRPPRWRHGRRRVICVHCGFEDWHHGRGLCHPCYQYAYVYRRPRPLSWPTHCCVCARSLYGRKGNVGAICGRCYMAAHRRGMLAPDVYAAVEENVG